MKFLFTKLGCGFFVGMVVCGCAGMQNGQWKFLGATDFYQSYYYVSKSHFLYKGTVQVWVKLEYTKKGVSEYVEEYGKDYEKLSYTLQLWEIDCPAKKQYISANGQYSPEGTVISNKPARRGLSGTLSRDLIKAVCD